MDQKRTEASEGHSDDARLCYLRSTESDLYYPTQLKQQHTCWTAVVGLLLCPVVINAFVLRVWTWFKMQTTDGGCMLAFCQMPDLHCISSLCLVTWWKYRDTTCVLYSKNIMCLSVVNLQCVLPEHTGSGLYLRIRYDETNVIIRASVKKSRQSLLIGHLSRRLITAFYFLRISINLLQHSIIKLCQFF